MPKVSKVFTPETPLELQREVETEQGETTWRVVGFYAKRPDEADEPGYRVVDRSAEPPRPAVAARRGGGAK